MKIYTLTIIKDSMDEPATAETRLYAKPEDAIKAYNKEFDDAKYDSQFYERARVADEIATNTPYRWWRVDDDGGSYSSITIELDAKEVM